jgi:hypothetical protein
MSSVANIEDGVPQNVLPEEDELLRDLSETEKPKKDSYVLTMLDYIADSVNLDVPKDVVIRILLDREVEPDENAMEVERMSRDLCKADLFVWACSGVSRRGEVRDVDNGWTHADGGYTLSKSDKDFLLKQANDIYEKYEEPTVGKTKVRITSYGIRKADIQSDGEYRPRNVINI